MIICKDLNGWAGKFGNRIFCLNNLIQISEYFGHEFYCKKFAGSEIFEISDKLLPTDSEVPKIDIILANEELAKTPKDKWVLNQDKNYELDWCIHEFFFEFDKLSTFEIFKYKKEYLESGLYNLNQKGSPNDTIVAIHFRGTDFSLWDSRSILPSTYYTSSIEEIVSDLQGPFHFCIYSDDYSLLSFRETVKYLKSNNLNHTICDGNSWQDDLISMAYSDIIISSPSTFCIVAGFTGKEGKKIIHSKEWVDNYRAKTDYYRDIFWKTLLESGGNKNYQLYKTI